MKRTMLTIVLVAALGGSVPRLGAQVPSPAGFPAVGQPAIVTLITPGAQPRKAMRYTLASGRRDHMNMDMLMGMSMSMAGNQMPAVQMPTMRMGADMAVTTVTPAGEASFSLSFTELAWVPAPGVDPQVMAMLQSMPINAKELQGTGTVSSRGVTHDVHLDLTKISNPQLAQTMGAFSSSMENLAMPFPEEAVGVGARWEVRQAAEANGMRTFQKYEFELVTMDENGCALKTKVEQSAPPQAMNNPALPPGTDASIEKFTGTGAGTMAIRWDSLVPTSELSMRSSMIINLSVGGQSQQMSMDTTTKVTVSPVK
jgi:hypothetical protein